jgi:hypothetical protein
VNSLDSGPLGVFDDVEVFFAWNAKDLLDTLILKGGDEQVGAFHGLQSSLGADTRTCAADLSTPSLTPAGPSAKRSKRRGRHSSSVNVWASTYKHVQRASRILVLRSAHRLQFKPCNGICGKAILQAPNVWQNGLL